jgi:hypothetical protein
LLDRRGRLLLRRLVRLLLRRLVLDRRLDVGTLVERPVLDRRQTLRPLLLWRLLTQQSLRGDVEDPDADDEAGPALIHHPHVHETPVGGGPVEDPAACRCYCSDPFARARPGPGLQRERPGGDPDATLTGVGKLVGCDAEPRGVVAGTLVAGTLLTRPLVLLVLRHLLTQQPLRSDVEDADADHVTGAALVH